MKWKALAACTLAGLALIAAGCGGGDKAAAGGAKAGGQDLKGKKLVMYVSFHEDTAKELADLFKKQTGADVSFIRLPTGEALARITAEKDAPKADIWLGGTADAHAKAAADGLLEAYKSKNAKMIMPEYQDKDGFWYGTYLEVLAIGYNEKRFNEEFKPKGVAAPTTLQDLLKPEFKGEIIMPDPRKSGTGNTFISSGQKAGAGEYLIAVNFISDQNLVSAKGQKLVSTIYDQAGWTVCPVGKIKNKANEDVAKAFIDFVLTKEAGDILVKTTNGIACNPEVAPPQGMKPLKELPLFKTYDLVKAGADKQKNCDTFFAE